MNWLGKHFAVNANLYYMYGLERAGMLYGTEKFGDHDWYLEGAKSIVRGQKDDGSWGDECGRRKEHHSDLLRDPLPEEGHSRDRDRRPEVTSP